MSDKDDDIITDLADIPRPVPYGVQLQEKHAEQAGMSRDQIVDQMKAESEAVEDLDAIVDRGRQQTHHWVERGLKLSCEGAGHPNHHIWKRH